MKLYLSDIKGRTLRMRDTTFHMRKLYTILYIFSNN